MRIKPWIRLFVAGASFLVGVVVTEAEAEAAAGSGAEAEATRTSQSAFVNSTATPPDVPTKLIAAVGPVLAETIGGSAFPEPDVTCLGAALDLLSPEVRAFVDELVVDPTQFHSMFDDVAAQFTSSYIGCVDEGVLAQFLAATTSRVGIDDLSCLTTAWVRLITPEAVASSLAYGNGLDDLPPDIVNQTTLQIAACVPDQRWWVNDEAAFLQTAYALDNSSASCVATGIVDAFGLGPIIKRRLLTLNFYPIASRDLELVVTGGCGLTLPSTGALNALPGTCLAGFATGDGTEKVTCGQPHNAEVVAVIDLGAEIPEWPGWNVLRQTVIDRCIAELEALTGDISNYAAGWDIANRQSWEQADRTLTCMLIHPDFSQWTGASGLVPTCIGKANPSTPPQCGSGVRSGRGQDRELTE